MNCVKMLNCPIYKYHSCTWYIIADLLLRHIIDQNLFYSVPRILMFSTRWTPKKMANIFKFIFNQNRHILIQISLKYEPTVLLEDKSPVIQVEAWHRIGVKPLFGWWWRQMTALYHNKSKINKKSVCLVAEISSILSIWHRQRLISCQE